jgi:hypothetical protein
MFTYSHKFATSKTHVHQDTSKHQPPSRCLVHHEAEAEAEAKVEAKEEEVEDEEDEDEEEAKVRVKEVEEVEEVKVQRLISRCR